MNSSLLKNGDWLRGMRRKPREWSCREVPVPFFQQADGDCE